MNDNIDICEASEWSPWEVSTKCGVVFNIQLDMHNEGYNEYDCGSLTRSRTCNENLCAIQLSYF